MGKKSEARRLLRRYLARRYHAKENRIILQKRMNQLKSELRCGEEAGHNLEGIKASVDYLRGTIHAQIILETFIIKEVDAAIRLLPQDSTERTILELRHVDCLTWAEIVKTTNRSRSGCNAYYNKGLDALLEQPMVRVKLAQFKTCLKPPPPGVEG